MNITQFATEHNRVTIVALLIILVGGVVVYQGMPRDYDPGFVVREARIVTYFPGASPGRVEQLVTDKLEKVIQEIPELDHVVSESRTGVSVITVKIKESYKAMRSIWDNLRRKVLKVEPELPEGISGPFINDEFGDIFGIVIGITGEGFSYAEIKKVADQVRDELLLLDDIARVEIHGTQEERIFIEYNNARLAELGLSPHQLVLLLSAKNIIIPGGEINVDRERISLEPTGNYESIDDIRQTIISIPGSKELLYLRDVANVKRGYIDPPASIMHTNGEPALGLAISMRKGGNLIDLGADVKRVLRRIQAQYPIGIEFEALTFHPAEVDRKINDFVHSLLLAVAVVMGVMLLFMGLRTGLLVGSLIPFTMLVGLLVMSLLDIGLDQISIAAMTIALGLLVDNAIVMTESITVQVREGKPMAQSALDSASELRIPLLTSSLTTAAAFLPIYLAESSTGEYTEPLFKVVSITLLSSWLLTMTMIPLMCIYFLKVGPKAIHSHDAFQRPVYRGYRAILAALLRYRWLTLGGVIVVFACAMYGFRLVPVLFFPPSDRSYFKAEFEMPVGTSIETQTAITQEIEAFIESDLMTDEIRSEGVINWATYIGSGGPRFVLQHVPMPNKPNYTLMVINTTSQDEIDEVMARLEGFTRDRYPDLKVSQARIENGPPVAYPIEIRILGRDSDILFDIADEIKNKLYALEGTKNVASDWGLQTKKLIVHIDEDRARRAGVTSQDIALSLQTGLSGMVMTEYREDDKLIPVILRTVAAERQDIGKLQSLNVFIQATGESVPLRQVADVEVMWQPAIIYRRNRLRAITISSDLQSGWTADRINEQLIPWLKEVSQGWGAGYRYELGGEVEASRTAQQSIQEKLAISGLIIVLILVVQFNSIRKALIILMTIPLGMIGVVVGLLAVGTFFGFMTLLGIISLAGIVINNAIVLLERIKLEIEAHGLTPQQAIIMAAQRRLRPILLTTLTTMLGLVPLWLGGGAMWEPLAVSIIFGLAFATLLTLGVVPVLYALYFRVDYKQQAPQPSEERTWVRPRLEISNVSVNPAFTKRQKLPKRILF